MSEIIANAKRYFADNKPFVLYCKPNSDTVIGLFQKDCKLYSLTSEKSGFAFVSFDNKKRYLIPDECCDIYFEKIASTDFFVMNEKGSDSLFSGKNEFESLIEKALLEIDKGTFEKVVLSRKEVVGGAKFEFDALFSKLIATYSTAFRYVFYHPEIGFWLGATPEQLIKVDGNLLQTVSLAGTQLHLDNDEIVWTEKEIVEQQIVTDYIVSSLKPFSNEVIVDAPKTSKAGRLAHIKTDIRAAIELENIDNIIAILHPTPAVCGFPKAEALQFIIANEGYDRAFYAGFLGEWKKDFKTFQDNKFDLFVNLRCMHFLNNELNIYVGCGITKASIPENEYIETVNKSMTMKQII
jgi:isochorismate synthase